jgi:hypothetical protein
MTANAAVPLLVLFYDDRYNETRDRLTMPVYRSLDRENIPFLVGSPEGTISTGRPGDGPANRKLLHYRPGHKIRWLLQVLPTVRAELVLLLDTDVLWLCSAAEVIEKRVKTLAQMEQSAARTVILFGEKGMWPPYQEFRGVQLRSNETAGYPPATAREPFRFVNAGAALGRPRDVLAMLECMQARYEGFPDACPAGHGPDGELRYYSPNRSYVPPPLVVPSRLTKYYHGMRLHGSNWGWEQGCFHMYYLEHVHAELTAACPPVMLDRAARWLVNLAGVNGTSLALSRAEAEHGRRGGRPRALLRETGERPCALHANGPSKASLKPLAEWWNGRGGAIRRGGQGGVWSQYEEAGHGPLLLKGLVVRRNTALSL